jgi:DNA-binding response OmpR family regulator
MLDRMADRKPRVLIIDEDRLIVVLMGAVLERNNFEVLEAMSGRQGLELAKTGSPDVILLDLLMLGTDGLEVLRQLRLELETMRTPVILLTGLTEERYAEETESLGVSGYVVKPYAPTVLVDKIMETCGIREREPIGIG